MRLLASWTIVLVIAGLAGVAHAEKIYRYRDGDTSRDVFVNRLDQVPARYRDRAQLVVSDGVLAGSTERPGQDPPQGTVIFGGRRPADTLGTIKQAALEAVRRGPNGAALDRSVTMAIDTTLVGKGQHPLSPAEVARLTRLVLVMALVLGATGLLAMAAWIAVMVDAFRSDHRWWMAGIFLFHLLGIVYVLIWVDGKRRWFKFATLLGQCAPYAVVVAMFWRSYVLWRSIMAARGLG
jgi:hypothetical protein